jgi:hypothetical protein
VSQLAGGSVVSVVSVVGVAGVVRRVVGGSVVSVVGVAGVVSHVRVAGGRRAKAGGREGEGQRRSGEMAGAGEWQRQALPLLCAGTALRLSGKHSYHPVRPMSGSKYLHRTAFISAIRALLCLASGPTARGSNARKIL